MERRLLHNGQEEADVVRSSPLEKWASFTFAPLRMDIFRGVWCASLATNLGGQIQAIAAAWLMLSLNPSPTLVALVQTANTLPLMLFSLLAGGLADTVDRRIVMISALTLTCGVSACLVVASAYEVLTPTSLLAFTFLIASGLAFFGPSWQASVIEMAPLKILPQAVALNALSFNAARSVGPAIGAEVVALAGATAAFALNCFSYLGIITVLVTWKRPKPALNSQALHRAMGAGIRFVYSSSSIRRIVFQGFGFYFATSAPLALIPVLGHTLDHDPRVLGALLGGIGVGAMIGALTSAHARAQIGSAKLLAICSFALSVACIAISFTRTPLLALAPIIVSGACWTMMASTLSVAVQQTAPQWVVGRAISIYMTITFAGMAGGAAFWGSVAASWGVFHAFVAAGFVFLGIAALNYLTPIRETSTDDIPITDPAV